MAIAVAFAGDRTVEILDRQPRALGPSDVRVQTLYSGISAGTELTVYRGTNPYLSKTWDQELRLFVEGEASWAGGITLGYEEVGRAVEVGDAVTRVAVGDLVWGAWGHTSEAVLPEDVVASRLLPAGVDPRVGIFSFIGGIALNLVLDADIHLGETVALFGLGVPGQLAAQFARLNGARVIAVDGLADRRALAAELGADVVLDPADGDVAARIRDLTEGRGADVALEITGNHRALHEAIRSVAHNARVCTAGFMQGDAVGLRLGEEFHHNRVNVVSSQISGVAPGLQHRWDVERLDRTAIDLAVSGRVRVLDLISHTFPARRAGEAFTLLDERPSEALQVVLDFP